MANNKQKYTPVRFSHLISYASVGSIVRGANDKLMVIKDIRYWCDERKNCTAREIPYVKRVSLVLNIDKKLKMPPIANLDSDGRLVGSYIPASLFPTYAICEKCGLLHNNPWKSQDKKYYEKVSCEDEGCDGNNLEQVTWCTVCDAGYLDDVPWHEVCHKKNRTCQIDYNANYLRIKPNNQGKSIIKCDRCKSSNLYQDSVFPFMKNTQPWLYGSSPKLDKDDKPTIVEVNSPAVFSPNRVSAIVIPPESRIDKHSIVDKLYNNSTHRELEKIKSPDRRNYRIRKIADDYKCSIDEVNNAICEIENGYPYIEDNISIDGLYEDEYKAFLATIDNIRMDEDFVTEHKTNEWHELKSLLSDELLSINNIIDNLVIANRLREIQVFKGFTRNNGEPKNMVPADIVGESDWLPAIELFGEGIFFTLDIEIIEKWESLAELKERANEILQRYQNASYDVADDIQISPRFLLLHTIAHMLIRELETVSGYPAASLKERIYCSKSSRMAGVLIFTAVPDIVGSLGGIIENGIPNKFLTLMDGLFKHSQWCSLDPVCSEHQGQGPGWLNRAACHGCALVPETSCSYRNVLLDRVMIKGSAKLGIPSFLDFVAEEVD